MHQSSIDLPIIQHLTLLAEQIAPALARMPKQQRYTLGAGTWQALDALIASTFGALATPTDTALRTNASVHFDRLKWYLRLLAQQRAVSPGWYAARMPDLVTVGRMLGGMRKAGQK